MDFGSFRGFSGLFSHIAPPEKRLGAVPVYSGGVISGFSFSVWAPNALSVSVAGDFNGWDPRALPLTCRDGVWRGFAPGAGPGASYKFFITPASGEGFYRADPLARFAEVRPGSASRTYISSYVWNDRDYLDSRPAAELSRKRPLSVYEMHLGSWKDFGDPSGFYAALARELPPYLLDMGFTHVEFMPVAEHPFDGSWGYQTTGYFAPTSRYGSPDEFKLLVDSLHRAGIGVILDWVPAHFPRDESGLRLFDGSPLFELPDERLASHAHWGTLRFNLQSPYVRDFLISNALFWLDEYHIDGLRVDAVASMLRLDYAREEYIPNIYGGREDLGAIEFLKMLNRDVSAVFPSALMFAEDSSDFPGVTAPADRGGLGFTYKWNMGWMNDTLKYMGTDPLFRRGVHHLMTFSMSYAFGESYILPLSHDECVHGKRSLLDKMSGDYKFKFASFRTYLAFMFFHPGKKLLFMGGEFGQFIEWRYYEPLEWKLLAYESHRQLSEYVKRLLHFYRDTPALWADDGSWDGFFWSNPDDTLFSVYSCFRRHRDDLYLLVLNATPVPRPGYLLGVPGEGGFSLVFNSDKSEFYGYGAPAAEFVRTKAAPQGRFAHTLCVDLPPGAALIYKYSPTERSVLERP